MLWGWLRKVLMGLTHRWNEAARRHYVVDHEDVEAIRQRTLSLDTPSEERHQELEWLRSYQRELDYRLKAAELDAKVIARLRARVVGHE
jgi:hypothetical protein